MRKQEADGLLFSMKVSTRQVTIFNVSNTFPARMNALFLATEGCSKARPASTHEETHLFVVLNSKTAGESYHTNRPAQKRQEIRFSVRSQGSNGSQCVHRRAQSYSAQNQRWRLPLSLVLDRLVEIDYFVGKRLSAPHDVFSDSYRRDISNVTLPLLSLWLDTLYSRSRVCVCGDSDH